MRNLYQEKPALPFTPGGEFCGTVLELGAELEREKTFEVGQVVAGAVIGGGAMAEELVVPDASTSVFIVPVGISPAAASSFPIAYGTAYMALAQRARVGDDAVAQLQQAQEDGRARRLLDAVERKRRLVVALEVLGAPRRRGRVVLDAPGQEGRERVAGEREVGQREIARLHPR